MRKIHGDQNLFQSGRTGRPTDGNSGRVGQTFALPGQLTRCRAGFFRGSNTHNVKFSLAGRPHGGHTILGICWPYLAVKTGQVLGKIRKARPPGGLGSTVHLIIHGRSKKQPGSPLSPLRGTLRRAGTLKFQSQLAQEQGSSPRPGPEGRGATCRIAGGPRRRSRRPLWERLSDPATAPIARPVFAMVGFQ